jgi:transglutaminase-like putative cysteine protease
VNLVQIKIGFALTMECEQPTAAVLVLKVSPLRVGDLQKPQRLDFAPACVSSDYQDVFGNTCTRTTLPAGRCAISSENVIDDAGAPDAELPVGAFTPIEKLPAEVLVFLLASRYCDTDLLSEFAWKTFGMLAPGAATVHAVRNFVHQHVTFGYEHARNTRTASEALSERKGVCRDFAHLAIALCRCMGIPARYVAGYLGDIGVPPDPAPMDFSGWFEVWLDGRWYAQDARHNVPRIGRIPLGFGRDAADVAMMTTFGPCKMLTMQVTTEQVG